jgi:hypothetical protein
LRAYFTTRHLASFRPPTGVLLVAISHTSWNAFQRAATLPVFFATSGWADAFCLLVCCVLRLQIRDLTRYRIDGDLNARAKSFDRLHLAGVRDLRRSLETQFQALQALDGFVRAHARPAGKM